MWYLYLNEEKNGWIGGGDWPKSAKSCFDQLYLLNTNSEIKSRNLDSFPLTSLPLKSGRWEKVWLCIGTYRGLQLSSCGGLALWWISVKSTGKLQNLSLSEIKLMQTSWFQTTFAVYLWSNPLGPEIITHTSSMELSWWDGRQWDYQVLLCYTYHYMFAHNTCVRALDYRCMWFV